MCVFVCFFALGTGRRTYGGSEQASDRVNKYEFSEVLRTLIHSKAESERRAAAGELRLMPT